MNNTSTAGTCTGTATEPCLRETLTYVPSISENLVEKIESNPSLPGSSFGDAYQQLIRDMATGQPKESRRVGKTRVVTSTNPEPRTYTTVFSYTNGRLTSIDPPETPAQAGKVNTIDLTYWDPDETAKSGQLKTMTRNVPGGAKTTQTTTFASYNERGQPTEIVGADGVTTTLGYDAVGRLTKMTSGTETTEYSYDPLGRLSRVKLPGGTQCVHYLYSEGGFGELTTIVIADSCPANPTTADGNYAELTYDSNQRVTGIAFYTPGTPGKKVFQQTVKYDAKTGKISRRYDNGTDQSRYKQFLYDAFQRLTDAGGELCSSICGTALPDCNCPRTALTSNGLGQVLTLSRQLQSGNPLDTTLQYDNAAQVSKVMTAPTASSTATTSYVYDDFGRVVEVSSPDSGITRYEYDGNDNVIKRRVAPGTSDDVTTTFDYDGANRLIAIKHGDYASHCKTLWTGQDVKLHYDAHTDCSTGACKNDCPTGMCQNGATRLVMAEVEVGCTGFLAGTPVWQQHWYSYDAQGRVVGELYRWPVGTSHVDVAVGYQYDTTGNLTEVKLPTNSRIIYTRGGNGPSDAQQVTKVQYDWLGLNNAIDILTDVSYQPFGPVSSYTLAANCPGTTTPITVDIIRDTAYLVDDVKTSCLGLLRRDVQTDVPPRAASITDPSPRTCSSSSGCLLGDSCDFGVCKTSLHNSYYSYDYASRLTCDATTSTTCLETASTTRTAAAYSGENLSRLTYRNGYTSGQTLDFQYAPGSNRLTSASSGGGQTIAYASDNAGRRISDTEVAHLPKPSPVPQPNLDAAGRYFFYYPSGRQLGLYHQVPVQKGSYDHQFVLSQYDHRGLRIAKQIYNLAGGVELHFYIYDPAGNLLMDIRFLPNGQLEIYEYVNLEGMPVFQRGMSSLGILDMFLVGDHLGRAALGVWPGLGGAVLWRADADAFGWTRPISFPVYMPHRLPGQYEDTETAVAVLDPADPSKILMLRPPLHYNWHRTYDPMVGRYLEPDPVGQGPGLDTNLYRYVWHDPVNRTDLWGLKPGDVYATRDMAAMAAMDDARALSWQSVKANDPREFGGWIAQVKGGYTYTEPRRGTTEILRLKWWESPKGTCAVYHSHHAAPTKDYWPARPTLDDVKEANRYPPTPVYMGDPWKNYLLYDPVSKGHYLLIPSQTIPDWTIRMQYTPSPLQGRFAQ